jgi:hypothetical protein
VRARLWLVGVGLALAAGALARAACLGAEFWLDEIWSLELARDAASPFAVLFNNKHDNNHHLNTIFLTFVPDGVWWGWYRLHSLFAGTASIALAAKAARRWGRAEAVVAAWLVAGCSWLILASAEARGYALCVLFALVAFDALWGHLDSHSRTSLVVYWAATVLGFLSHLTFIYATLGFVVWSLRRFAREGASSNSQLTRLALTHGPPGLVVAAFYVFAVRGMAVGGGPTASPFGVLASLIGRGLGGPDALKSLPFLVGAAGLFAFGLRRLGREGSDLWVFFLVSCLLAPGLYLAMRPPFLFERYFFVSFTFFLVLASYAIVRLGRPRAENKDAPGDDASPGPPRRGLLPVLILLPFLVGNGVTVWRFAQTGRGDFNEALAWVLRHDDGETVLVTSEPDPSGDPDRGPPFRTAKYVRFYQRHLFPERDVRFVANGEQAGWLFIHRIDDSTPDEVMLDASGRQYHLAKSFPSRGPGAWGWFIYRKVE